MDLTLENSENASKAMQLTNVSKYNQMERNMLQKCIEKRQNKLNRDWSFRTRLLTHFWKPKASITSFI